MLKNFSRALLVAASLMLMQQAASAADISVHEVYQAAQSGHLREAQQMMQQVLREHPESAKAHYVEAELYAQAGQLDYGRRELTTAQRLDPTLSFAPPASIQALEARLTGRSASATRARNGGISWGLLLLGAAVVLAAIVFIRSLRQRAAVPNMAPGLGGSPTYSAGYGPSYGPGYNPGPYGGGGMGSGIMGGLATGAAIGAGMVAGEALASHFIDGDHREGHIAQPLADESAGDWNSGDALGGDDFGISDNSSWDSGGDIGGDWS